MLRNEVPPSWRYTRVKAFGIVSTVIKMMRISKSLTSLVDTNFVVESGEGGRSQKLNNNDSPPPQKKEGWEVETWKMRNLRVL
jgi:hypothetical protein